MPFCSYDAEIPCWMYRTLESFWRGYKPGQARNSLLFIVYGKSVSGNGKLPRLTLLIALRTNRLISGRVVSRTAKLSSWRLGRGALLEHHWNAIFHRIVAAAPGAMQPCV
jgi:hypothetical protein